MSLRCEFCGHRFTISADHHADDAPPACPECGAAVAAGSEPAGDHPQLATTAATLPPSERWDPQRGDLRLTVSWMRPIAWTCLGFSGMAGYAAWQLWREPVDVSGLMAMAELPTWIDPFLTLTGGICAILGYYAACLLLNRTSIHVTPERITVAHGPIPARPGLTLRRDDVLNLVIRERHIRVRHSMHYHYEIAAILPSGRPRTIVPSIRTRQRAEELRSELLRVFHSARPDARTRLAPA